MSELKLKQAIAQSLHHCLDSNLADCTQNLFQILGYQTDKATRLDSPTAAGFWRQFDQGKGFNAEVARAEEWQFVDLVFKHGQTLTLSIINRRLHAIDSLKVLDPAVGSGAFPMGMLQKLVFILGKLDPNNEVWKYQQKEREIRPVLEDLQQAQKISYEQAREAAIQQLEERLAEIEADFTDNEMDYPRKLFLIENSIYGVDIQPIAVQIAKLRFFISLIVEQRVDDNAPNRGILPLPNLETKFIAANTLMSIDRPAQMTLGALAVQAKEQELAEARHRIFTARTQATKNKYREKDQHLREEIAALLKREGWADHTTPWSTLKRWCKPKAFSCPRPN